MKNHALFYDKWKMMKLHWHFSLKYSGKQCCPCASCFQIPIVVFGAEESIVLENLKNNRIRVLSGYNIELFTFE